MSDKNDDYDDGDKKKNSAELAKIHVRALKQFDAIMSAVREERKQSLEDRRFYSIPGAMWEGDIGEQFDNRIRIECNKINLAVVRIFNEFRNNRITVDFVPKGGKKDDAMSDFCDGIYRADEQDSRAPSVYDNASEEAVGGGIGAWRYRAVYVDEDDDEDERQRIAIEPIYDADSSVFFDVGSKNEDKSDAGHCFVIESFGRDAAEEEWGESVSTFDKSISKAEYDWVTDDVVYVAEYYLVEKAKEAVEVWTDAEGNEERHLKSDLDDTEYGDQRKLLRDTGWKKIREKRITKRRVHKYILSGSEILEDCGYIAGPNIPIVMQFGKRWVVDNVERAMGHVRLVKDATRVKNMLMSKLAEIAMMSSIEKPILTPQQILGHEQAWADDNIENYSYLLLNPITDATGNQMPSGPIGYTKPPQIPPALAALMGVVEQDIRDLLGNQEAGEQIRANSSGKAVELIQQSLGMHSYIYMDNKAKAMRRGGEIYLGMAPEVYFEPGREMKTVNAHGDASVVTLMQPSIDKKTGEAITANDFSRAKMDVFADIGPSSSSQRSGLVKALTGMMAITADPETLQVLTAMAMTNMEGEGLGDARDYFRKKLLAIGAATPTEDEKKELAEAAQNAQPNANDKYLIAAAKAEDARAIAANAKVVLDLAKAEETEAKTIEILSGIDKMELQNAIDAGAGISQQPQPPQQQQAPAQQSNTAPVQPIMGENGERAQ